MVLIVIARHGQGINGNGTFATVRRIALMARISTSTAWTALKAMRQKGWLSWNPGNVKGNIANTYTLHLEAIPKIKDLWRSPIQTVAVADTATIATIDTPVAITDTDCSDQAPQTVSVAGTQANTSNKQKQNTNTKRAPKGSAPPFALPDWVPKEEWDHFDEMRKGMRNVPWTDHAKTLIVQELARLREAGDSPADVLNRSVAAGYRGVFALNGNQNSRKKPAQRISEIDHKAGVVLDASTKNVGRLR